MNRIINVQGNNQHFLMSGVNQIIQNDTFQSLQRLNLPQFSAGGSNLLQFTNKPSNEPVGENFYFSNVPFEQNIYSAGFDATPFADNCSLTEYISSDFDIGTRNLPEVRCDESPTSETMFLILPPDENLGSCPSGSNLMSQPLNTFNTHPLPYILDSTKSVPPIVITVPASSTPTENNWDWNNSIDSQCATFVGPETMYPACLQNQNGLYGLSESAQVKMSSMDYSNQLRVLEDQQSEEDSNTAVDNLSFSDDVHDSLTDETMSAERSLNQTNDERKTSNVNHEDASVNIQHQKASQNVVSLHLSVKRTSEPCDDSDMYVNPSNKKGKKLCCPYCNKTFAKLSRHMEAVHADEVDVKAFVELPKGSSNRRAIQDALRKCGSFQFNTDKTLNEKEKIVSRRPNLNHMKSAKDYSTCPSCLGQYSTSNMRRHGCAKKMPMIRERSAKALSRQIEGRMHVDASDRLKKVASRFRDTKILRAIRFDWLLTIYGNKLCLKHTFDFQDKLIRTHLRTAGRLLVALKSIKPQVSDFAQIYYPKMYDDVIASIRIVGRYNEVTNEFGAPQTAGSLVTALKHIGQILITEYIKKEDPINQKKAEDFLTVLKSDIGISVLKAVSDTQAKMRREKKQLIPTTDDIQCFMRFLDQQRNLAYASLSSEYTYENWLALAELTMAAVIVFNRRRVGETQNILVTDFLARENVDKTSSSELYEKLSEPAKAVIQKYSRMTLRGKKGRPVKALLKPAIVNSINLLLKHRTEIGIPLQNKYLFGLPSCSDRNRVIDGCHILRKFSVLCGAKKPETLRGTTMRKHIATICVALDLNDGSVSQLANFMGHDDKIHRDFYRQNPLENEIVQIAQILEVAQGKGDENDDVGDDGDDDECVDQCVGGCEYEFAVECDDDCENVTDCIDKAANKSRKVPDATTNNDPNATTDDVPKDVVGAAATDIVQASSFNEEPNRFNASASGDGLIRKKFPKRPWSTKEVAAVRKAFADNFEMKTLPSTYEILGAQKNFIDLQGRTWPQIKTYINNHNKKQGHGKSAINGKRTKKPFF